MTINAEKLLAGVQANLPALEKAIDFSVPETELLVATRSLFSAFEHPEILQAIKDRMFKIKDTDTDRVLLNSSVSKPRMNKYCLAQGPDKLPYRVWLHEYISKMNDQQDPYVEGEHNQRYPITSLILREGYGATEHRWLEAEVPGMDNSNTSLEYWTLHKKHLSLQEKMYQSGDVMTLHTWESHALHDIGSKTLTFVLEAPAVRNFSVAFDGPAGEATKIITDVENSRETLLEDL